MNIFHVAITQFSRIVETLIIGSCEKPTLELNLLSGLDQSIPKSAEIKPPKLTSSNYNLEKILPCEGNIFGKLKFRKDNDAAKIITLDGWVRYLNPNHNYLLQRAADTNLDLNGAIAFWFAFGKVLALLPQLIMTVETATGQEQLWRERSKFPSAKTFDIHSRVLDEVTLGVLLTSDCNQHTTVI